MGLELVADVASCQRVCQQGVLGQNWVDDTQPTGFLLTLFYLSHTQWEYKSGFTIILALCSLSENPGSNISRNGAIESFLLAQTRFALVAETSVCSIGIALMSHRLQSNQSESR